MPAPNADDEQLAVRLDYLRGLYGAKRSRDFEKERAHLRSYLRELLPILEKDFRVGDAFKVGGSGIVFRLSRRSFEQQAVLKINRPNTPPDEESMVAKESAVLPVFSHSNIISVIDRGILEFTDGTPKLSYIIEPLIPSPKTLDEFLTTRIAGLQSSFAGPAGQSLSGQLEQFLVDLAGLLAQWVAALEHLHTNGYLYLDVKPENVLVDQELHLVLIDFGSVEKLDSADENPTSVFYTERYAHPRLIEVKKTATSSNRVRGSIKRKDLTTAFDLYALGRSILELLSSLADGREHDCPQIPLFRSLHFLATRLLDGRNGERGSVIGRATVVSELFGGLSREDYSTIPYTRLADVQRDLQKELGSWNPEFEVPELATYSRDMVRVIPDVNTVLSPRLKILIEHPVFARLKLVTQLGLISLVYPTADHSRYDHALGTYTYVTSYVKSLFNDIYSPVFRNLIDEADIKAALLAALLHDLGQYPLAHDLEELHPQIFGHPKLSIELLDSKIRDSSGRTIAQVVSDPVSGWGVELDWLKRILGAHTSSLVGPADSRDFKADMLSALIDGPIDADKADYISRDSSRCGIPYGNQLDIERLLRVLTITALPDVSAPRRVTVGVYDKGRPSARAFGLARYLLFSSVYWHHTSRVLKAMLQYGAALVLPEEVFLNREGPEVDQLRTELVDVVLGLNPPSQEASRLLVGLSGTPKSDKIRLEAQAPEQVVEALEQDRSRESSHSSGSVSWYPGISWTDWLMLKWLSGKSAGSSRGARLIRYISERKLYKRIVAIPREDFAADTRERLTNLGWRERIRLSEKVQEWLRSELASHRPDTTLSIEAEEIEAIFDRDLAVLVDVPNPSGKMGFRRPLVIVPELKQKSYYQEHDRPIVDTEWTKNLDSMMQGSAPVRVLCHPDLRQPISALLQFHTSRVANEIVRALDQVT